ncbi:hypothetical protein SAMN05443252_101887 [Bacillus sp. OV322]|nr:hypothetical protein SAMN05443252_101887 [Bacillus sp. OV322]
MAYQGENRYSLIQYELLYTATVVLVKGKCINVQ